MRFHLLWEYRGIVRGQRFATWAECEAFSRRLIAAGLVPWLTHDSPDPYFSLETVAETISNIKELEL